MSNEQKEISTQRGKKKNAEKEIEPACERKRKREGGKNGGKRGEKNTHTQKEREREREKYRCTLALKSVGAIENCSFSEIRTAAGKSFADLE